jgi:ABC-type dipeptide/oligopeptide/nickel transport system permease component
VKKTGVVAGLAIESLPSYFAGIILLRIFSYRLGGLPSSGVGPSGMSLVHDEQHRHPPLTA